MTKGIKIILSISLLVLAGLIYYLLPTGMPDGTNYFKPLGERALQPDELGQFI